MHTPKSMAPQNDEVPIQSHDLCSRGDRVSSSYAETAPISTKAKLQGYLPACKSIPRSTGSKSCQMSQPVPPVPQQQQRRSAGAKAGTLVNLDSNIQEIFGPTQPIIRAPMHRTYPAIPGLLPPALPFDPPSSLSISTNTAILATPVSSIHHVPHSTSSTTPQQLPILRNCTFVLLRILIFPKTIFVRSVSAGKGCLQRVGIGASHRPRRSHNYQHISSHRERTRFRSHNRNDLPGDKSSHHRSRSESDSMPCQEAMHSRWRRRSVSRSRSHHTTLHPRGLGRSGVATSSTSFKDRSRACYFAFRNNYNVQVALVSVCLTGESFAQSMMVPFLYYMVRDFQVGPDVWIGYYAGLLWTGFWSANLVTTLFWGHLSDKYGRKVVLLFGLFMTSISTLCLGLSTRYHDAMLALIIQGACTSLIPVSKCSIGEMANRQQRFHDTDAALARSRDGKQKQHRQLCQHQQKRQLSRGSSSRFSDFGIESAVEERIRRPTEGGEDIHSEEDSEERCIDSECCDVGNGNDSSATHGVNASRPKKDFAAKGYSSLVIAMALGAALGPWAGGSLTKTRIPGYEAYPYFAPCLLASLLGIFITGTVALLLNETHPKLAEPLEKKAYTASSYNNAPTLIRGRSGYDHRIRPRELKPEAVSALASVLAGNIAPMPDSIVVNEREDYLSNAVAGRSFGERPSLRLQTYNKASICTCPTLSLVSVPAPFRAPLSPSLLSPASELYLTLAIYTLLVLTSIIGSEFIMLYTQSPVIYGGLEFSAKALGQALTLRGILKLIFNIFGYPWMVSRFGLLRCLKLGILVVGAVSVFGLGWFVPWSIHEDMHAEIPATVSSGFGFAIRDVGDERRPSGMGPILLCLSLISMGDVLGYVSVLVLFGKSADRLKGANKSPCTSGMESSSPSEAYSGGSGILWGLAQVSANVMRLAGPVLAGLIWSLSTKSKGVQPISVTDLHHVFQSSSPEYRLRYASEFSQTYAQQSSPQSTFSLADSVERALHGPRAFWTIAGGIVGGSTSVFYLVGAICILNFVACHVLDVSSPTATSESSKSMQCASGAMVRQRTHQHGQEECSVSSLSQQDREPCRVHDLPTSYHLTA